MKSVTLSDGRRKYFQSKIRHWWIEDISNWNRKNLELHFDGYNFTLRKMQLCILMVASLHLDGCFFASWWLQLCILMVVSLHLDDCNFASWWLFLCILIVASLHLDGCFFAWLPPMIFLEAKSPTFFFLILNELHSAAENFTFLTKTNYIPYENVLHSLPEYTSFS